MKNKFKNRLIIFVKAPKIGRAKTRLSKDIGAGSAINFYRQCTAQLIQNLSHPAWQIELAIDPFSDVKSANWAHLWPLHMPRIYQTKIALVKPDLGQRMRDALAASTYPAQKSVLIGSDTPNISTRDILTAFNTLDQHQYCFGPAHDGGYWLVGVQRAKLAHEQSFMKDVRWSTAHALADTLKTIPKSKHVSMLSYKNDIDTGTDYQSYHR